MEWASGAPSAGAARKIGKCARLGNHPFVLFETESRMVANLDVGWQPPVLRNSNHELNPQQGEIVTMPILTIHVGIEHPIQVVRVSIALNIR